MFFSQRISSASAKQLKTKLPLETDKIFLDCHNLVRTPVGLRSMGKFVQIPFAHAAKKVVAYCNDRLYIHTVNGLYTLKGDVANCVYSAEMTDVTSLLFNRYLILSSRQAGTFQATDDKLTVLTNNGFDALATTRERIFGVQPTKLQIAPAGQLDQWRSSLEIDPQTDCDTAVAVDNKLYLLGDVCYAYESKAVELDSKLYPIASNLGKVQSASAVCLGRKAVFAANGLYKLQSGNVDRVFEQLDAYLDLDGAAACALYGYYMLSCKRKYGDKARNDVTLLLDVASEKVMGVFDCGFQSLFSYGNDVYAVQDGQVYKFFPQDSDARYKCSKIDMGSQKIKYLDELTLRVEKDCEVKVTSELCEQGCFVKGSPFAQSIRLCCYGKEFCVEVLAKDGLKLDSLQLHAHAQSEVT